MKNVLKTVAMFNLSETRRDPRARRVAGTLASLGYRVVVFGVKSEVNVEHERLDNFEIVRVPIPYSRMDGDMTHFDTVCPAAAHVMRTCNPLVMEGLNKHAFRYNCLRALRYLRRRFSRLLPEGAPRRYRLDPVWDTFGIRSIMLYNLALYCKAEEFQPDLVYSNDLDTLLCGFMFKANRDLPLIFDAHEIYPEQFPKHMRSDIWRQYYTGLEKALLPYADGRLTVCGSLGRYFERAYGSGPFLTIRNCPSRNSLPPESILDRRSPLRTIVYHGAYFQYRGLEEAIKASKAVENARFVFRGMGDYEQQLKRLARDLQVEDRVVFAEPVTVDALVSSASEGDIGLSPFISVCLNTQFALPNKFFEYMAAGLALVSADLIEMRLLTERYRAGVLYESTDVDQLSKTLNELIADPHRLDTFRRNAYYAARDELHWEREEIKLRDYVRRVFH